MGHLSRHFTYEELTATSVRHVSNEPSKAELANLRFLCRRLLEPVREAFGPWYVTSGYRSEQVNLIIGGNPESKHVKGCAVDGVPLRREVRWSSVILFLQQREDLPVDQVIYEYGRWLHLGTLPNGAGCRRQFLMIFEPGKYEVWNPRDMRITK